MSNPVEQQEQIIAKYRQNLDKYRQKMNDIKNKFNELSNDSSIKIESLDDIKEYIENELSNITFNEMTYLEDDILYNIADSVEFYDREELYFNFKNNIISYIIIENEYINLITYNYKTKKIEKTKFNEYIYNKRIYPSYLYKNNLYYIDGVNKVRYIINTETKTISKNVFDINLHILNSNLKYRISTRRYIIYILKEPKNKVYIYDVLTDTLTDSIIEDDKFEYINIQGVLGTFEYNKGFIYFIAWVKDKYETYSYMIIKYGIRSNKLYAVAKLNNNMNKSFGSLLLIIYNNKNYITTTNIFYKDYSKSVYDQNGNIVNNYTDIIKHGFIINQRWFGNSMIFNYINNYDTGNKLYLYPINSNNTYYYTINKEIDKDNSQPLLYNIKTATFSTLSKKYLLEDNSSRKIEITDKNNTYLINYTYYPGYYKNIKYILIKKIGKDIERI